MSENINLITTALVFLVPVAVIVVIAFAIYKAAYKRRINKRLAEGREADIKPMISPVKFVVITLICLVIGLVFIWGMLILFFSAKMNIDRLDMMSMPSVRIMNQEVIADSPFDEYSFGDEIKGYTRHTLNDKDTHLEVYTVNDEFIHILPSVIVAAEYTGNQKISWSNLEAVFKHNRFSTGLECVGENGYVVINTGGYHGEFKLKYNLFYDDGKEVDVRYVDLTKELKLSVNEYGQVNMTE